MASSWDSYYIIFLSGVLSLCIPLTLGIISFIFFPRPKQAVRSALEEESSPAQRSTVPQKVNQIINIRFFLATNAALVLIALSLELIPCVATIQSGQNELLLKGLISVVSLAAFAALGLIYATKKGNMKWLPSSQVETARKTQGDMD